MDMRSSLNTLVQCHELLAKYVHTKAEKLFRNRYIVICENGYTAISSIIAHVRMYIIYYVLHLLESWTIQKESSSLNREIGTLPLQLIERLAQIVATVLSESLLSLHIAGCVLIPTYLNVFYNCKFVLQSNKVFSLIRPFFSSHQVITYCRYWLSMYRLSMVTVIAITGT